MVGLRRIVKLGDRFVLMGIEGLANNLIRFDAMLAKQLLELLQRHLNALMKLLRVRG